MGQTRNLFPEAGAAPGLEPWDRCWVPAGRDVTVGEHRIPGGMIYVGSKLPAVRWGGVEPALIDPALPCSVKHPDRSGALAGGARPYGSLPPASRGAFLEWLAAGRSAPDAYLGYVLLYFSGIERRVLFDAGPGRSAAALAEAEVLLAEVERLMGIYGRHFHFISRAASFLALARLMSQKSVPLDRLEPLLDVRTEDPASFALRIGLGSLAAAKQPIPPRWALAWWQSWLDARPRTQAQRCPAELRELFAIRYPEFFPEGLRLKWKQKSPPKPLTLVYLPVNPTFGGPLLHTAEHLVDVSRFRHPLRQVQELVDRVCQELDPYSRWVGTTGEGVSPAALGRLPPELLRSRGSEVARSFVAWVEETLAGGGSAVIRRADLLERWPVEKAGRLGPRGLEALASFLGVYGFGLEPDPRFGLPPPRAAYAIYRLPAGSLPGEPGRACQAAAVVLQLAVAVATADGEIDPRQERRLLEHVEQAAHLEAAERARLEAHLLWLLAEAPGLNGVKARTEVLAESRRHAIGRFLITVAGADGHVSPEEIVRLTRIYSLLGLDPQTLYADAHALVASGPPAAEPVLVRPAAGSPHGFALPAPAPGVALDLRKIEAKLAETERVASLLDEVFSEDEAGGAAVPAAAANAAGLDSTHMALLRELAASTTWDRAEVERLAVSHGLLPGGALEVLNEAAIARCGAPVVEGHETLEIDPEILEELLA